MAGINVPITVEAKQAKNEINGFNKDLKMIEQGYKAMAAEAEVSGDKLGGLYARVSSLSEQLTVQQKITAQNAAAYQAQVVALEAYRQKLEDAKSALSEAQLAGNKTSAEMDALQLAVGRANMQLERSQTRVNEWARNVTNSENAERLFNASIVGAITDVNNYNAAIDNGTRAAKEAIVEINGQSAAMGSFGDNIKAAALGNIIADMFKALATNTRQYIEQGAALASQWAVSQQKLTQVMGNTMGATKAQVEAINELTAAQQRSGIISQAIQTAGAQELATYLTKASTLKALIPIMNDMNAQQNGINATAESATTIATMLGKVMDGQVGALKRYGYSFDEAQEAILKTGEEAERAAVLVEVISGSVGGMNAALANTDAGKQAQLNFILQETQTRIGEIYNSMKMDLAAGALPAIEEFSKALLKMVEDNKGNIKGLLDIVSGLVAFFLKHSKILIVEFGALGVAMGAMKAIEAAKGFLNLAAAFSAQGAAAVSATTSVAALAAAEAAEANVSVASATAAGGQTVATVANTAANTANAISIKGITAAMAASPLFVVGAITTVIMGVVAAVDFLTGGYERQIKKLEDLSNEHKQVQSDMSKTEGELMNVADRIDELSAKDTLTIIDKDELTALEALNLQLERRLENQKNLERVSGAKLENETVNTLTTKVDIYTYNKTIEGGYQGEKSKGTVDERVLANIESYRVLSDQMKKLNEEAGDNSYEIDLLADYMAGLEEQIYKDVDALNTYKDNLSGATEEGNNYKAVIDNVSAASVEFGRTTEGGKNALAIMEGQFRDASDAAEESSAALEEVAATVEDLSKSISAAMGSADLYNKAIDEQNKSGELSVRTVLDMINAGTTLAIIYNEETGKITLNGEALKRLTIEKINEQEITLQRARSDALINQWKKETEIALLYSQGLIELASAKTFELNTVDAQEVTDIEAQILLLENLKNTLGSDGGALGSGADGRLTEWQNLYKERENESKKWIDRQKFYGQLTLDEEIAANKRIIDYLNEYKNEVSSLYYASAEEKLKITKEIEDKIEAYNRNVYTAEKSLLKEHLAVLTNTWSEWETELTGFIGKEKFYNRMPLADEIEAYESALIRLNELKKEAATFTYASEEDRTKTESKITSDIDKYERLKYSASKLLEESRIKDAEYAASRKEKLLQKELADAESYEAKNAALGNLRKAAQTQLNTTLASISNKFWLSEKEKLREMEAAYDVYAGAISGIDKSLRDNQRAMAAEAAAKWLETEKKNTEAQYKTKKDALSKELEQIKEQYRQLDEAERAYERGKQISDLQADADIYAGAATLEGQRKYKSITEQIERLKKEAEKESRQDGQRAAEERIKAQMDALDVAKEIDIANLEQKSEKMKDITKNVAQMTVKELKAATKDLESGVNEMIDATRKNITETSDDTQSGLDKMGADVAANLTETSLRVVDAFQSMAERITDILNTLNIEIANFGDGKGGGNNNTVNINEYGDKIFNNRTDETSFLNKLTDLMLYNLSNRMG